MSAKTIYTYITTSPDFRRALDFWRVTGFLRTYDDLVVTESSITSPRRYEFRLLERILRPGDRLASFEIRELVVYENFGTEDEVERDRFLIHVSETQAGGIDIIDFCSLMVNDTIVVGDKTLTRYVDETGYRIVYTKVTS